MTKPQLERMTPEVKRVYRAALAWHSELVTMGYVGVHASPAKSSLLRACVAAKAKRTKGK